MPAPDAPDAPAAPAAAKIQDTAVDVTEEVAPEPSSTVEEGSHDDVSNPSPANDDGVADQAEEAEAPPLPSSGPEDEGSEGQAEGGEAPPLPPPEEEPGEITEAPPLPDEPVPEPADDGWDCQWHPTAQQWMFYNRFTGKSQWENPRVVAAPTADAADAGAAAAPPPPADEKPPAGGYNPAIHGDYDPNAWYAKGNDEDTEEFNTAAAAAHLLGQSDPYGQTATFNRFTGQFQTADMGPGRHTDEAKANRQMGAFFDVDAAANTHDGRSLRAERSSKQLSKNELKAFKEKRRARKEEKRRAWLRD